MTVRAAIDLKNGKHVEHFVLSSQTPPWDLSTSPDRSHQNLKIVDHASFWHSVHFALKQLHLTISLDLGIFPLLWDVQPESDDL